MKQLSIIFVLTGCLLGYGGYQLFNTEAAQKDSLAETKVIIEQKNQHGKQIKKE